MSLRPTDYTQHNIINKLHNILDVFQKVRAKWTTGFLYLRRSLSYMEN